MWWFVVVSGSDEGHHHPRSSRRDEESGAEVSGESSRDQLQPADRLRSDQRWRWLLLTIHVGSVLWSFMRMWRVYPLGSRIRCGTVWFNHQLRFMGNVVVTKCLDAVFRTSSGRSGASGETSGGHDATGRALHRGPAAERRTSLGGIWAMSVCRVWLFSSRCVQRHRADFVKLANVKTSRERPLVLFCSHQLWVM